MLMDMQKKLAQSATLNLSEKDVKPQLDKLRASLKRVHKEVVDTKERKTLMDMQKKLAQSSTLNLRLC
ncbi:hypothetical protein PI124_g9139 [Phytophthora idaei]|nr:hypothetical protein PI125_g20770 [Phytophthora idaei]KAG3171923.1 hypothetical protein PI126_g1636 [Phytophthora idaei]KAG3246141.1 hypothetical protein PI124_g9139 [Phytophthora idaei]